MSSFEDDIRNRIVQLFTVFPKLSHSMVQVGLGSAIPAKVWRPELDSLIEQKVLKEETVTYKGVSGRFQTYTVISMETAT